uniref:EGF-like domain-containing protein n=1 Tax=Spermophilus dauricus TaxID=99837 RepID=A0A8C9URD4_SPEDA
MPPCQEPGRLPAWADRAKPSDHNTRIQPNKPPEADGCPHPAPLLPLADVDECKQNPRICKGRSTCINTQGSYTCQCLPGFELNPEDPKLCTDVDECSSGQQQCHQSTICTNTLGSYQCHCRPGWEAQSKKSLTRENTYVDECKQNPRICKGRSTCINTQGSYTCQCLPGFELNPEDPKLCTDVNECASGQNPCHKSTHCLNQVGGYQCRCRPGWKPVPGSPNGPNSTVCEGGAQRPHSEARSTSLSHFFDKVNNLQRDFKPVVANETIQVRAGSRGSRWRPPTEGGEQLWSGRRGTGPSTVGSCSELAPLPGQVEEDTGSHTHCWMPTCTVCPLALILVFGFCDP